ncbi:MAG: hypothetical protein O2912_04090 [Proteobacteria bacterium]|nr:hypothetical protein [Pseudomonadota bacterium]
MQVPEGQIGANRSPNQPLDDRYPHRQDRWAGLNGVTRLDDFMDVARSLPEFRNHERVFVVENDDADLTAYIAIHSTRPGPAIGGVRYWPYLSPDEALRDALKLSRTMTLKSTVAGLAFGGAKAVIVKSNRPVNEERLFRAFASAIEALHGQFHVGQDVGTSREHLDIMAMETRHVLRLPAGDEDQTSMTALGVREGIKAALTHRFGTADFGGRTIAVQGLGKVGFTLCRMIAAEQPTDQTSKRTRLLVADIDREKVSRAVNELNAEPVDPAIIAYAPSDVFAPCALGGVIDDDTAFSIDAAIIAGSANDPLAEPRFAGVLNARGILYAPDYVINAGGMIAAAKQLADRTGNGYDAHCKVVEIGMRLKDIFEQSRARSVSPTIIAEELALERLTGITNIMRP